MLGFIMFDYITQKKRAERKINLTINKRKIRFDSQLAIKLFLQLLAFHF